MEKYVTVTLDEKEWAALMRKAEDEGTKLPELLRRTGLALLKEKSGTATKSKG